MFPIIPIFIGSLVFLFAWHFLNIQRARSKLPPGPAALPVIGNLGTLGFQIHHERLLKIASQYGNVFTLWLGSRPLIVLSGYQAVKEALINHSEEFAGKPDVPFHDSLVGNARGIIFSNGHVWKQQRRFSLMTLRNLGLGKRSLEDCIQQEAKGLIQVFSREKGNPLDPYSPILSSINNVIASVLFGHCFSTEDDTFQRLIKGSKAMAEFEGTYWPRLYNAFPVLMKLIHPILNRSLLALTHWKSLQQLIQDEILRHRMTRLPEEPRDFIDLYLAQLEKCKDDPASPFTEPNMVQVIMDLFIAGSDTSTIALCWALLYMMAHPGIQEQVQEELDRVLDPAQPICYEDRKILPFTNAVLHETQRYSSISAIGIVHKCTQDTTLQGWPISKGAVILANIFSVHYDPEQWETPRKFNPNHFLDQDGNFVKKEAFLLFSAGIRMCLGEKMARTMLFILFASLLRAFSFRLPEGVEEIPREPIVGFILQPRPYKACAVPR